MLRSFRGLVSLPTVLRHPNAISTLVCLNRSVTLRMCGEMKVNAANFLLFLLVCCVVCSTLSSSVSGPSICVMS